MSEEIFYESLFSSYLIFLPFEKNINHCLRFVCRFLRTGENKAEEKSKEIASNTTCTGGDFRIDEACPCIIRLVPL